MKPYLDYVLAVVWLVGGVVLFARGGFMDGAIFVFVAFLLARCAYLEQHLFDLRNLLKVVDKVELE